MLDLQDQVPYPDLINKFSSLASEFSGIQTALRRSGTRGHEDFGHMLKMNLAVPQMVSMMPDPNLQVILSSFSGSRCYVLFSISYSLVQ